MNSSWHDKNSNIFKFLRMYTYPFKKSKKSTKNCKMFTVKKTEKQLFPFILITKRDIAKILTDLDSIKSDRFVLTGGWIFIQNLTVYLLIKLTCYLICIYRQLVVLYYTCEDDGIENHNAPGITSYEQIWSELDNTNFYIFTQFFFLMSEDDSLEKLLRSIIKLRE